MINAVTNFLRMEVVRMKEEHWFVIRKIRGLEVLQSGRQSLDLLGLITHYYYFKCIYYGLI